MLWSRLVCDHNNMCVPEPAAYSFNRVCIIAAFTIYVMAGREIFAKRHQLRAFTMDPVEATAFGSYMSDPSKYRVTNEYQVTSECVPPPLATMDGTYIPSTGQQSASSDTSSNPKSYTVNITSTRPSLPHNATALQRKNRATMEANRAAFGYAKVASLFFVSLLVTWVPSSLNRVYSLIYPDSVSVQYAYAAGIVLSLMGFWNAVIYIATSHRACGMLFSSIFGKEGSTLVSRDVAELSSRRSRVRESYGDSIEGLAGERQSVGV